MNKASKLIELDACVNSVNYNQTRTIFKADKAEKTWQKAYIENAALFLLAAW